MLKNNTIFKVKPIKLISTIDYFNLNISFNELNDEIIRLNNIIKNENLIGEYYSEFKYDVDILLSNASHKIIKCELKNNKIYIEAELLNTHKGHLIRQILFDFYTNTFIKKVKYFYKNLFSKEIIYDFDLIIPIIFKFQLRSVGIINENTIFDFKIITIDIKNK